MILLTMGVIIASYMVMNSTCINYDNVNKTIADDRSTIINDMKQVNDEKLKRKYMNFFSEIDRIANTEMKETY